MTTDEIKTFVDESRESWRREFIGKGFYQRAARFIAIHSSTALPQALDIIEQQAKRIEELGAAYKSCKDNRDYLAEQLEKSLNDQGA